MPNIAPEKLGNADNISQNEKLTTNPYTTTSDSKLNDVSSCSFGVGVKLSILSDKNYLNSFSN